MPAPLGPAMQTFSGPKSSRRTFPAQGRARRRQGRAAPGPSTRFPRGTEAVCGKVRNTGSSSSGRAVRAFRARAQSAGPWTGRRAFSSSAVGRSGGPAASARPWSCSTCWRMRRKRSMLLRRTPRAPCGPSAPGGRGRASARRRIRRRAGGRPWSAAAFCAAAARGAAPSWSSARAGPRRGRRRAQAFAAAGGGSPPATRARPRSRSFVGSSSSSTSGSAARTRARRSFTRSPPEKELLSGRSARAYVPCRQAERALEQRRARGRSARGRPAICAEVARGGQGQLAPPIRLLRAGSRGGRRPKEKLPVYSA